MRSTRGFRARRLQTQNERRALLPGDQAAPSMPSVQGAKRRLSFLDQQARRPLARLVTSTRTG